MSDSDGQKSSSNVPLTKPSDSKQCYTDPNADVILVSTQGRHFHVQSYFLRAHSNWFRKNLVIDRKPITINVPSAVLKCFLDLMHFRPLPGLAIWAYRVPLLNLVDQFGCPGIGERITFGLLFALAKNPWEIFIIASQRGNLSLAKAALKVMDDQGVKYPAPKITQLTPELTAGVSLPYLLGLFNAVLKAEGKAEGKEPEWRVLADYFMPVKCEAAVKR